VLLRAAVAAICAGVIGKGGDSFICGMQATPLVLHCGYLRRYHRLSDIQMFVIVIGCHDGYR
jgi:hypothetical protein